MRKAALLFLCAALFAFLSATFAFTEDKGPSYTETKKKVVEYIRADEEGRRELAEFFARVEPLSKRDIRVWTKLIEKEVYSMVEKEVHELNTDNYNRFTRSGEFFVQAASLKMKYFYRKGGRASREGVPLFINLHGGGNAKATNDSAYDAAKGQYSVDGCLVVPRAPKDEVLSWGIGEMQALLDRVIFESNVLRKTDPDKIYIMGYSMGGWGTLLLGPAMADRWAAVASSAGGEHVQRANPENLRNTPIIIQIGTEDHAYKRYELTKAFADAVKKLHEQDSKGYKIKYVEHEGMGHQIPDKDSAKWLAEHTRNPYPKKIVWKPLIPGWEVNTFYYLRTDSNPKGAHIVVTREGNTFSIERAEGISTLHIRLNGEFVDFDEHIVVMHGDEELFRRRSNSGLNRSWTATLNARTVHSPSRRK
ncbi:MAG: dienelactone hydrolase family protein [Planctomycetota bacterium]|nr:dienelactone hydrolase family protein [Planctomycetota bacterium]